jgi:predicted homoserine dehydrogenase-like protein
MSAAMKARIGIVGTGFVGAGLVRALDRHPRLQPSAVLTRRDPRECTSFPHPDLLTRSRTQLLETSDLVIECSGDAVYAATVVAASLDAGLPVVTVDAEFQITLGSFFTGRGLLTEAEGDQPGSIAALRANAIAMGFRPIVYGNAKGFLEHHPTRESMQYWSAKQGISLAQVTSFTDGTKLQIEQALVANGFGARLAEPGLIGPRCDDLAVGAHVLAERAAACGEAISDYVLCPREGGSVFVVAEHDECERDVLRYLKLGDGPFYVLRQPFHLCHLEVAKTVEHVLAGGAPLLDNSAQPRFGIIALAKRQLEAGDVIDYGIGSFEVRGVAWSLADSRECVPIALLRDARIRRCVRAEEPVTFDDVDLPDSFALRSWLELDRRLRGSAP